MKAGVTPWRKNFQPAETEMKGSWGRLYGPKMVTLPLPSDLDNRRSAVEGMPHDFGGGVSEKDAVSALLSLGALPRTLAQDGCHAVRKPGPWEEPL